MDADTLRIAAFLLGSCFLIIISRRSLTSVASHGFYRFFAWESILALLLVNLPFWFRDPFSFAQIVSWVLLCGSLFVLVPAILLLRAAGKPAPERKDSALYEFERTSELVTSGIYKYIRHPMYASLLFLSVGAWLKNISPESFALLLASSLFLTATAKADEKECIRYFGSEYEEYKKRTTMFVPFIY
ncbi:MAG: methyltransferase [Bacteroidota bacterium]